MKKVLKYFSLIMVLFLFTQSVQAKTIEHFNTKADETITLEDDVNGSSAIAGTDVETKSKVKGVNFLAGNKINHKGESDYLVAAGNDINISGNVMNDTVIAGNIVTINDNALLQRDTIIAGNDIEIKGGLERNVTIYGATVSIKGANIKGNVKVYANEIKVDDETIIGGSLSYPEDAKAEISSNITNITKTEAFKQEDETIFTYLTNKLWSSLALILIFALLTLFIPQTFEKINDKYEKVDFNKGTETFTKGLVFLIIIPVIMAISLLIPFGIPLSLILLAIYFILIYLSKVFAGYFIGYKLWQNLMKKDINILLVGILGFVTIFIIDLIPGINMITSIFALLFGLGIIIELLPKKNA